MVTATAVETATAFATVVGVRRRGEAAVLARSAVPEGIVQAQPVTVAPSSIPTYASACSGSVRYSSACSCIGITAKVKYICQLQRTLLILSLSRPLLLQLH